LFAWPLTFAALALAAPPDCAQRVAAVTSIPGFVALWDFVKREPGGARRFVAHVPPGATNDFALDAANYVREFWGQGREATYDDFPLLGAGPFGQAIGVRAETDSNFRPLLLVPRARLHDSPLDVKGPGRSVTLVAWVAREEGNHAIAGIWHEGTDLGRAGPSLKVQRGMRQYALFAGLQYPGCVAAHVSENGASSFGDIYARHKPTTTARLATVPRGAGAEVVDRAWSVAGLVFDNARDEASAWLDGKLSERWDNNPKSGEKWAYGAWRQADLHRRGAPGGDPKFPRDQFYLPPEGEPRTVTVVRVDERERVEVREFRYTRVQVTLRREGAQWTEVDRDLVGLRVNPWWFPHDLYTPAGRDVGGPFTIGRVIHMGRSVGFTGWIGGVAVFDRALRAEEMARLAAVAKEGPAR
jgi:hypothetical protein